MVTNRDSNMAKMSANMPQIKMHSGMGTMGKRVMMVTAVERSIASSKT
jgi:hypothetical protein